MVTGPVARRAPRQARSQATVDVILDGTARVLVERGYAGLTTNRIAERAGVSVGSVYQYFSNKAALLAALQRRHMERMETAAVNSFSGGTPRSFDEGLIMAVDSIVQAHLVDPDLHRALETLFSSDDTAATSLDASLDKVQKQLAALLAKRNEAKQTAGDAKLSAFVVVQAVHALVHAMVRNRPRGISVKQLTGETTILVRAYLDSPR